MINDVALNVASGVRTGLFDVAYHNDWREEDNVVDFTKQGTITSIEVTVKVEGLTQTSTGTGTTETAAPSSDGSTTGSGSTTTDTTATAAVNVAKTTWGKAKKSGTSLNISWKKAAGAQKYEVQVSTSKKMTKATKKTVTKTSCKMKGKKNKKYYVRVRGIATDSTGNTIYGKWSTVKKIK